MRVGASKFRPAREASSDATETRRRYRRGSSPLGGGRGGDRGGGREELPPRADRGPGAKT